MKPGSVVRPHVFMILRAAGRLLTGPLSPLDLAARALAAVFRPPLLFLAMVTSWVVGIAGYLKTEVCAVPRVMAIRSNPTRPDWVMGLA